MAAQHCPNCGAPLIPQSTVCSTCGALLTEWNTLTGRGSAPSPPQDPWRIPGYPDSVGPTPESQAADRHALSDLSGAALCAMVAFAISAIAVALTPALAVVTGATSPAPNSGALTGFAGLGPLFAALVLAVIFSVVELALYRRAFRSLERFDVRFRAPGSFATLALVCAVVFAVLAILFVWAEVVRNSCAGVTSCLGVGEVLLLLGPVLLLAALVVVGFVGVVIGIWRAADHFGVEMFKPAAILLILIGIVGAVLLLLAVHWARQRTGPPVGASPAV